MKGSKSVEQYFCKLCGIGFSEINAINPYMINQVEFVLKDDLETKESINQVVQKLTLHRINMEKSEKAELEHEYEEMLKSEHENKD